MITLAQIAAIPASLPAKISSEGQWLSVRELTQSPDTAFSVRVQNTDGVMQFYDFPHDTPEYLKEALRLLRAALVKANQGGGKS